MPSSNLAARMELAAPDLLSEPARPRLKIITSAVSQTREGARPRLSLEFRSIVIRDHGFRRFRVY